MKSTRGLYTTVSRGVTALKNVTVRSATRSIHVSSTRNLTAGSKDMARSSSSGLAGSSSSSRMQNTADDVTPSTQTRPVSTHSDNRQIQTSPSLSRTLENERKWMFPVDERMMEMYHTVKRGAYGQGVRIKVDSKRPITPQEIETALLWLAKKADAFRAYFQYRGNELWVAEMLKPFLDFKVTEGTDAEQLLKDLIATPQRDEEPLWRARVLYPQQEGHKDTKDPYSYTCHLLISLSHAVHDGVVLLWTVTWMVRILDDIVSGVQINDEQYGFLRSGIEIRQEEEKIRKELLKDPQTLRRLLNKQAERNTTPLMIEAFGVPDDPCPATKTLEVQEISGQFMQQFGKKCKSVGVSLNSAFLAAYNVALIELVREAGLDREVYNVTSTIPVDTRRFLNGSGLHLGFHSIPLNHTMATPRDVKKNFWQYVKEIDDAVRGKMKNKHMLTERVLDLMLREEGHEPDNQSDFPPLKFDYTFSNIYFIPQPDSGLERNVRCGGFFNLNTIEKTNNGILTALFADGDLGLFKSVYSSRYMTEETAVKWTTEIIRLLHEVY